MNENGKTHNFHNCMYIQWRRVYTLETKCVTQRFPHSAVQAAARHVRLRCLNADLDLFRELKGFQQPLVYNQRVHISPRMCK